MESQSIQELRQLGVFRDPTDFGEEYIGLLLREQKDLGAVLAVERPEFPDGSQLFAESLVHSKAPFFVNG